MSRLLTRLLLVLALLISVPVVFTVLFFICDAFVWHRDRDSLLAADVGTGAFFAICWIMIWRGQVRWTTGRRSLSACAAVTAVVVGALVFGIIISLKSWANEAGVIVGGLAWCATWVALTAWCWRETPAERAERLRASAPGTLVCPKCGYNLTGLRQARCPECGTQFTLDELYAAATDNEGDLPRD